MTWKKTVVRTATATVLAAGALGATAGVASAGNAGAGSCNASKGTLWCGNDYKAPLYRSPSFGTPDKPGVVVDRLRTTYSWFACWRAGDKHTGGNTTWYYTTGDDYGRSGWVPASYVYTTSWFDKNTPGLEKC